MAAEKFSEAKVGESFGLACLLVAVEEKLTKNSSTYVSLTLSDGESEILANYWNRGKEEVVSKFPEKSALWAELDKQEYQGKATYVVKGLDKAPTGVEASDFIIRSPYKPQAMYDGIMKVVHECCEGETERLVEEVYTEHKDKLLYWSAAKAIHHNCYGGLLYHTLRMVLSAKRLSELYPVCNKSILIAATALHDIGKLVELETDELGTADYTAPGLLKGHLYIGASMIEKKQWEDESYKTDEIDAVIHCILSHHGNLEWGAVKLPSIPEAFMLFHLDMIDSRMYICEKEFETLQPGEFSDKTQFALGVKLYHP